MKFLNRYNYNKDYNTEWGSVHSSFWFTYYDGGPGKEIELIVL
jgi:hypothetical protein